MIPKSIAEDLASAAHRGRGNVVIQPSTALAIAVMLECAWSWGTPQMRRFMCDQDPGLADRLIALRNREPA